MWTHSPMVLTNPVPDLPLSSSNSQHSPGHEAWRPCLLLMYANVLHPSVRLLNLDFTCFQPCSRPSYSTFPLLASIHTSSIDCSSSSSSYLFISFLPLRHQGARLPGSEPALTRSGWGEGPPPLPVSMQIGLVLIKRQLHISFKSWVKMGKGEGMPLWGGEGCLVGVMLWKLLFSAAEGNK